MNQYKELAFFYEKEITDDYYKAEELYLPSLKEKFKNIKLIKERFDNFSKNYEQNEREKLKYILKEREEIKKLTTLKIDFIDLELLNRLDNKIFDNAIKVDFLKVYYQIINDYTSNYCRGIY